MFTGIFTNSREVEYNGIKIKPKTHLPEELNHLADEYMEYGWVMDALLYWSGDLNQAMFDVEYILKLRKLKRLEKNWDQSDKIRDFLDRFGIYVFDLPKNETMTYFLGSDFFDKLRLETVKTGDDTEGMSGIDYTYYLDNQFFMSKRKYLEYSIEKNRISTASMNAWLYTQQSKKK